MTSTDNDELHKVTLSLTEAHLGHAVDQMRKSYAVSVTAKTGYELELVNRCAISSVLHGFCALESVANLFGFEMFFNSESSRFVLPKKRDWLTSKFIKTWDKANALDKLEFILAYSGNTSLPPNLAARLRELNTLRNWIAHGFSYTVTFLLESQGPEIDPDGEVQIREYSVVDTEESVDWKSKFPNTKFKGLRALDYNDARIALTIVLEVLKILSDIMEQPFALTTCEFQPHYTVLWKDMFDIAKVLEFKAV